LQELFQLVGSQLPKELTADAVSTANNGTAIDHTQQPEEQDARVRSLQFDDQELARGERLR
jgi:hypothetical protein